MTVNAFDYFELEQSGKVPAGAIQVPPIVMISTAYQEVLSDLAGGFAIGDFSAYGEDIVRGTAEELDRLHVPEPWRKPVLDAQRARSFKIPVAVPGFNAALASLPPGVLFHVLLNPARSFLYSQWPDKFRTTDDHNRFFKQVFDSIAEEVFAVSKDPALAAKDPETLNLRLIERFKEHVSP